MNIYLKNIQRIVNDIKEIEISFDYTLQKHCVYIEKRKIIFDDNKISYNIDKIIDEIILFLNTNSEYINCDVKLKIDSLSEVRLNFHRNDWCECNKCILDEIKNNNFLVSKKYIIFIKNIPLKFIRYKNSCYEISEDFRIKNDLFIKSVKILIFKNFKTSIICNGNNPHIDPKNNHYCLDYSLCQLELNYKNLLHIISSMEFANINSCYNFSFYYNLFEPIINKGGKNETFE